MTSMFSYWQGDADGGVIYLNGLTNEKDQRIRIVDWDHIDMDYKKIALLESRPQDPGAKKAQEKEGRKIAREIADQFNLRASLNSRVKNKFLSVVLSFSPSEREKLEADPQLQEDIVQEYLQQMEFENAQYLAVYHYDTNAPHIHLYVSMVGNDRKVFDSFLTKNRSQKACREIERKYGLKVGKGVDRTYKVDREKTNDHNRRRLEIRDAMDQAMNRYTYSFEGLKIALKSSGIELEVKTMNNGKEGLIFHVGGDSFAGGDIRRQYTFNNLEKELAQNKKEAIRIKSELGRLGVTYKSFIRYGVIADGHKIGVIKVITDTGVHPLLITNNRFFFSDQTMETKPKDNVFRNTAGETFTFNEIVKFSKGEALPERNAPAAAKTATGGEIPHVVRPSDKAPIFQAPAAPATKSVRDNTSAAKSSGDLLDEFDEIETEDGRKIKVKKTTKLSI